MSFTGAGVPPAVADGLRAAEDAAAMGVAPVSGDLPAGLRAAVVEGSGQAFMNGVHVAVVVTGAARRGPRRLRTQASSATARGSTVTRR